MELRYEGPHDAVVVGTAGGEGIEARHGDVVDIALDQVHDRLAGGWVLADAKDAKKLPEHVVIGLLGPDDCVPDAELAAELAAGGLITDAGIFTVGETSPEVLTDPLANTNTEA